ncbi:MAG: hypothetical protein AAF711_01265 [Planctomycetota bacterium]
MAEVIKFRCKACDKKITVRAEYAGKKAKCPSCKQPLRVPSPRPKRSATGVPVASGAASSPGQSAAGISLAELAAMEANAPAELAELSSKAASRPNIRIEGGKDCPECGASCKPDAVICVHCGHNFESGKKLKTKKESKMGSAVRSVASAAVAADDDGKYEDGDYWKYAGPTFGFLAVSIACFTGLVGMIGGGIPIEIVQDIKEMYEDGGKVGSGLFFLLLSGISGGVWWFMKR